MQQQPSGTQLPPAWMRGRDEGGRRCGAEPRGAAAGEGAEADLGVKCSEWRRRRAPGGVVRVLRGERLICYGTTKQIDFERWGWRKGG